jgi:hypothetical protein
LFDSVAEYPLVLVLACLLGVPRSATRSRTAAALDLALPLALGLGTLALITLVQDTDSGRTRAGLVAMFGLPAFLCYFFSRRAIRFGLGVGVILLASVFYGEADELLHAERTFFGVHRVSLNPARRAHQLAHGNTLHGVQSLRAELRQTPLSYYHPSGPVGQLFAALGARLEGPVAVIGLGAGALVTYALPGQRWIFYEIDPAVVRIARDPRFFTFLSRSRAHYEIVQGDARLSLRSAPDGAFGLMILDAYSSDAIPVHLATREALRLYLRKLNHRGILAFHISNQHLDLRPLLGNLGRDAGLSCLVQHDHLLDDRDADAGKEISTWLVMARRLAHLAPLHRDRRWQAARGDPSIPLWTDDYSSILPLLSSE